MSEPLNQCQQLLSVNENKRDKGKLKKLIFVLESCEEVLKGVPDIGEKAARGFVLIQMVICWTTGEYKKIPKGIIRAGISLAYVLWQYNKPSSGASKNEKILTIINCLRLVNHDIDEFLQWRVSKKIA